MPDTAAWRAWRAMDEALVAQSDNTYIDRGPAREPLYWPSTIGSIDYSGGFYGMSSIFGKRKGGKSLLALLSGIHAAASGKWQVVFFSAEDDRDGFRSRFNKILTAHPHLEDALPDFHPQEVGSGQTPQNFTLDIGAAVALDHDKPILVVLDSINSIAEDSGMEYLKGITAFARWARLARRMSGGEASFLVVAEENNSGGARGGKLEHWSDFILQLKPLGSIVEMTVLGSRRNACGGDQGKYVRDFTRMEYVSAEDAHLRRVV